MTTKELRVRAEFFLLSIAQLARLSLIGVTFAFALMGAASQGEGFSATDMFFLLLVAGCFHAAVYAWNDVCDLPYDMGQPRRSRSPLVRGLVSRRKVAIWGCFAAGASLLASFFFSAISSFFVLIALVMLLAYDIFGKKSELPMLTDLIQGIGWASLTLFGAATGGEIGTESLLVALYVCLLIVLTNGVHGGLRDLEPDSESGALTTAIWFGAKPAERGRPAIPTKLRAYAHIIQSLMFVALGVGLLSVPGRGSPAQVVIFLSSAAVCVSLMSVGLSDRVTPRTQWSAAFLHMVILVALPIAMSWGNLDPLMWVVFLALFLVPSLAMLKSLVLGRPYLS